MCRELNIFRRHRLESMNVNFAELSITQQPKFATAGTITFKKDVLLAFDN